MSRFGQGGSGAWRRVRASVLRRDGYRCRLRIAGIRTDMATQVDHKINLATLGLSRNDRRALDPTNLQAVCAVCHSYKTERERIKALAASNRSRAAARRARRQQPHPGDQDDGSEPLCDSSCGSHAEAPGLRERPPATPAKALAGYSLDPRRVPQGAIAPRLPRASAAQTAANSS
ncbi:HNH endonuclease [Mycobacteroides salmoniphilum]|uniref:HNH endonuclease n=1 Tax=Mycobacteroides salmoniphilum TaxID=404941 RepID=UPI002277086A|nr:HNH endonuclease signature motif containing protein [Mycobacteroides salmoniphilum]